MKKYIGYWTAGTTSNTTARESENITAMRRDMKSIARANCYRGDAAGYSITWQDGDVQHVEEGVFRAGRWIVENYTL